jgi:hypothetical protein
MTWRSDSIEVVRGQGRTDGPSYLQTGSECHKSQTRGEVACWNPKYPGFNWVHGVYRKAGNNTASTSFNRRHDRCPFWNIVGDEERGYESFRT